MITINLNGVEVKVEERTTVLEVCKFYGVAMPTLCWNEGLSPYGACRLCIVEIGSPENFKIVSSCTYPVNEGLIVRTHTKRILEARKLLIEMLVALCPQSKTIQDLASEFGVTRVRFSAKGGSASGGKPKNKDCILCGLCVRMCAEQMDGKAIGFVNRGANREITTPFDIKSDVCRTCGGCMYICPACQLRCQGPEAPGVLCNGCLNLSYPCAEVYDKAMCYMEPCGACLLEEAEEKKNKCRARL